MTEQLDRAKVLEQAIQKAHDNGWLKDTLSGKWEISDVHEHIRVIDLSVTKSEEMFGTNPRLLSGSFSLFDHGFAKALWGEKLRTVSCGLMPNWQLYLMEMVLTDDPIAYLAENMP